MVEAFDEIFPVKVKSYAFVTKIEIASEEHAGTDLYLADKEQSRSVTGVDINCEGGLGARGLTKVAGLL